MGAVVTYSTTGGKFRAETQNLRDARVTASHTILGNCGITMSATKVRRLVQRFEHDVEPMGWSFFDFLANAVQLDVERRRQLLDNPDVARAITYADPTGEAAVRNVMRGGGSDG